MYYWAHGHVCQWRFMNTISERGSCEHSQWVWVFVFFQSVSAYETWRHRSILKYLGKHIRISYSTSESVQWLESQWSDWNSNEGPSWMVSCRGNIAAGDMITGDKNHLIILWTSGLLRTEGNGSTKNAEMLPLRKGNIKLSRKEANRPTHSYPEYEKFHRWTGFLWQSSEIPLRHWGQAS